MEKKDNYVLSLGRKTRQLLLLVVMVWSSESMAQRIDFNNGTNSNYTASNFTAWSTGEITSGNTASTTIDGVTITIGHGTDTQATLIKSNWYKNGVNSFSDISRLDESHSHKRKMNNENIISNYKNEKQKLDKLHELEEYYLG